MKSTRKSIPENSVFKDRGKEAAFWEKHFDSAWKAGKPVTVKFAPVLSETINIRLDPKTLGQIRNKALKKGLGPTQLIRMWIMERLQIGRGYSPIAG